MPDAHFKVDWTPRRPPQHDGEEGELVVHLSEEIIGHLPPAWGEPTGRDTFILFRSPVPEAPPGHYRILNRYRDPLDGIIGPARDPYRYYMQPSVLCQWEGFAVWATGPDGNEYLVGYSPVPPVAVRVSHGRLPRGVASNQNPQPERNAQ